MLIGKSFYSLQSKHLAKMFALIVIDVFCRNLPAHQQEKLLKKIDKDGDGKISLKEFRQLFEKH